MKQNPWRTRLLLLGAILVVFGTLTLPLGLVGLLFGLYCIWYGLKLRPVSLPETDTQKSVPGRQSVPSSRPAQTRKKPPLPETDISEYQKRIRELARLETEADQRLASLTEYLNQLFADSQITKDRYLSIVRKAETITDVNLEKARSALKLFGQGPVTSQRLEILDGYIESSREMLSRIDAVVTELMRAEQSHQIRSSQAIEEAMNELKETAKYYAR